MTNMEKYIKAFMEAFEVSEEEARQMVFKESAEWDSMGHMLLISKLEETFDVELEPDEMLQVKSFDSGIKILGIKGIVL